ncbi:MAG: ComEC/Rec2 family competence protein [Calditrichota bacterium]
MDIFSSFSLNRIPILPFTLSAIGGVLLALHFDLPPAVLFWSTVILFLLALIALWRRIPVRAVAILSVLFILSLVGYHATVALDRNVRTAVDGLSEWGGNVELIGNVLYTDDPSDSRSSIVLYNAVLSNDSVEIACNALRIRVLTDTSGMPDLQFGDLVFVRGKLRPSAAYSPVSVGSIIGSLTRQEAAAMRAKPRDIVVQRNGCWDIRRTVDRVRAYVIRTFNASLSPDGAALCKALVLGERSDFSHEFNDELRITGLSHLFALSGMNVGFLAGALWLLLAVFYIPREIRLWILLLTVFFYMLLGREAPSLVRASIMASCLVIGHLLYRQPQILNTVAAAAFIELLWRPLDLIDAGFLLSYLAVIGILGGYSLVREYLLRVFNKPRNAAVLFGSDIVATTTGAQIGTIPLVGFLFGRMPLVGALGNIVAVPGFAVLMLWSVLLLIIQATAPMLTPYVAGSINALSYLLGKLVEIFASLPLASIFVPEFSIVVLILAYAGIAIFASGVALRKFRWILTGLLIVANLTI